LERRIEMSGFLVTILLFFVFAILMVFLITSIKGKGSVYLIAITTTLCAWFVGLVLDANIDFGEPAGFLSFRTLLPILAMGLCILNAILKDRPD